MMVVRVAWQRVEGELVRGAACRPFGCLSGLALFVEGLNSVRVKLASKKEGTDFHLCQPIQAAPPAQKDHACRACSALSFSHHPGQCGTASCPTLVGSYAAASLMPEMVQLYPEQQPAQQGKESSTVSGID